VPITTVPVRTMSGKGAVVIADSLGREGRSGPDDGAVVGAWAGNCFTDPRCRRGARAEAHVTPRIPPRCAALPGRRQAGFGAPSPPIGMIASSPSPSPGRRPLALPTPSRRCSGRTRGSR
jgi:hypothetical protein